MRDAVTSLIKTYDQTGRYFDRDAVDDLKAYFNTGMARIQVVSMINSDASALVRRAGAALFEENPELIRPGGNAYTTRRFAACLRDMDYYLRYASYALVAADNNVLNERVLDGLREVYNSLSVPIGPTVRGIQIMKEMIVEMARGAGIADVAFIEQPFDHLTLALSDVSV
jgi:phycobilisome core component